MSETFPWGDTRRFHSYSAYFRRLFGGRMQKVVIDAGFTCPNRDGTLSTGGCAFCNNDAFSPSYSHRGYSVSRQIDEGILFHRNRYPRAQRYLAYFQSYSNTYKPLAELRSIYDEALRHPAIAGIVVGTRPDCVDAEKLDYFAELAAAGHYVILEYGVESVYDETLRRVNRGHDFAAAARAIEQTAARGIHSGAHFILGLPGESDEMLVAQAAVINALPLDTVKFHQLQLFRDTAMARDYAEHPEQYRFRTLPEYIDLFIDLLERLRPELVIERFAGEAPPRYHFLPSPWGSVRNERLLQLLEARLEERSTWQGRLFR
ncbi:TIGR01212 family radical SAM protein [uncultured Rikenella sp.]|uniref:TIGR01212 family radical SAM protein n=1 Tax=uncultured Rikenella sp. TaxID=368003 RepID=UPI0025DC6EF0|nr:TIGR01212 family radical SAM protein [uncultured Rikenella sp.]